MCFFDIHAYCWYPNSWIRKEMTKLRLLMLDRLSPRRSFIFNDTFYIKKSEGMNVLTHLEAAVPSLWWLLLQVAVLPRRTPFCFRERLCVTQGLRVWRREVRKRHTACSLFFSDFDFRNPRLLLLDFYSPLWSNLCFGWF